MEKIIQEKYIKGLLIRAERKNRRQMSEILGESTLYRMHMKTEYRLHGLVSDNIQ